MYLKRLCRQALTFPTKAPYNGDTGNQLKRQGGTAMTPLLAPLVGDAPTITIIGLCKNAGKTTAMCRSSRSCPGRCWP